MASQLSFRKAFHPSRSGLALGVLLLLAQWAVWLWLLTDHLILDYQLPAVEKLQQANITTSVVLDRIAIYEAVVKQLLELKRLESE